MIKSIRFLRKITAVLALGLVLSGCGNTAGRIQTVKEEETDKFQIGMIFDNFVMERWQRDRDVFVSKAKEFGAEVNVQNANSSVEEQIALMDYFIRKKVDAIVIIPIDSAPLVNSVRKAQEEGIKVISYDRLIVGAKPDLYISFDNRKVGTLMAEALSQKLNRQDNVLMICGPKTDHNVVEVESGFREVMEKENISILDICYADGWKPETASSYIRQNNILTGQIEGLMCGNDNLAGQAVSALAEQQLAGKICVVGQDADLAACQRIVEGTQYMTVYKPVENLAAQAARAAVSLVQGNEMETDIYVAEDGTEVSYIKLEPIAVTIENMQEIIIDSGFHLKEDVYLNRPDLLE